MMTAIGSELVGTTAETGGAHHGELPIMAPEQHASDIDAVNTAVLHAADTPQQVAALQQPQSERLVGLLTLKIPALAAYGRLVLAQQRLAETRANARGTRRVAAYAGGLALNVGFLVTTYIITRSANASVEASGMLDSLHIPLIDHPPEQQHHNTASMPPNRPLAFESYPDPNGSEQDPTDQAAQSAEPFTGTHVALGSDPLAHGGASNVTSWSIDRLEVRLLEAGLSPTQAYQAAHDQANINTVNQAFYNDNANPHNQLVADDSHHYLNKGDDYSQVDQDQAAQKIGADLRHKLGLDIPTTPSAVDPMPPTQNVVPPSITLQTPTLEQTTGSPSWAAETLVVLMAVYQNEQALLFPVSSVAATGLAGYGILRLNRRNRRRKYQKALELGGDGSRSHGGRRTGASGRARRRLRREWRNNYTLTGPKNSVASRYNRRSDRTNAAQIPIDPRAYRALSADSESKPVTTPIPVPKQTRVQQSQEGPFGTTYDDAT